MNEEETLEIKESSEKSSDKIDEESNSQKEDIPETIEEEKKSEDKKITNTSVVEEITEDKNGNNKEIKQKKVDEIPQNMDSIEEIEKLANKNIRFALETDNEKKCKNPYEICNTICLIF